VVLYDGLDQVILSVGLVRPREGIFVDQVKWLLVLTTPVEIVMLAVTFEDTESMELFEPSGLNGIGYATPSAGSSWRRSPVLGSSSSGIEGDLKLNPTKFAVPTDNVNMLKVVGTAKGRIFMAGRDGSLNELLYQPEDGWFSRKCRKLNHTVSRFSTFVPSFLRFQTDDPLENIAVDEHRNILYALSSTNQLSVYDLGTDGEKMEKVETLNELATDVKKTATQRFEGLDKHSLDIVSMHPINPSESLNVHLVCITRGGHRLYFSTYSRTSSQRFNPSTRPKRLHLLHVRFPPALSDLAGGTAARAQSIDAPVSFYSQGVFLCAHIEDDQVDAIITTSSESTAITNPRLGARLTLPETPELLDLQVKVLAFAESPLQQLIPPALFPLVNTNESVARNELAQQHSLPPRQLVLLTNSGLYLLEKSRPVEYLHDLLVGTRGADAPELRQFFSNYGPEQACCMCLVVATNAMSPNAVVSGLEGGVAAHGFGLDRIGATAVATAGGNRRDPELVSWATTAFFKLGGRPSIQQFQNTMDGAPDYSRVSYSGSHDGFALFLSRILQPIWVSNIFVVKDTGLSCRLSRDQFSQLQWQLIRLKHFLQQNPHFASIRRGGNDGARDRHTRTLHEDPSFDEAMKAEQQSLSNLHQLLLRCLEALAFLNIMAETDLSSVQLSRTTKPKVGSFKFKDLVISSDPEIVREMIHGMTSVYSQQSTLDSANVTVEELTATLRQQCPSFFSDSDKTRLQAMDLLYKARSPSEHYSWFERLQLLSQSLEQFKTIPGEIASVLPEICHDFQYLHFFEGVVELSLSCANAVDPNHQVIGWYKSGQRTGGDSSVVKDLVPQLENCYQQIIYVLNELYGLEEVGTQRGSAFTLAGEAAGDSKLDSIPRNNLNDSEWRQLQTRTLKACRASTDEVFHIAFYQWHIDHHLATEMLQQETPYLENFLRFFCKPIELRLHLLWQFYLHRGELTKSANILLQLAEGRGTDQTLQDRLGHLAQALSLLKASPSDHQLLREVQEKVEVGSVQLKIYNELETVSNASKRSEARRQLDYELFSISDLFNQFAKKFGLSESALAILHVSGHQDARLARRLWETMIKDSEAQIRSLPPPYNTTPLAETIFNLASEYYPSEYVLPLDFLVDTLEQVACSFPPDYHDQTWYRGWVANAFLRAQIPAPILYKIYSQLFEARTTFWIQPDHNLHLIAQICYLLEAWVNEIPSDVGRTPHEYRLHRAKVDPAIEKFSAILAKSSSPLASRLNQVLLSLKKSK
jgi:nuclear pore complex protein Nup155